MTLVMAVTTVATTQPLYIATSRRQSKRGVCHRRSKRLRAGHAQKSPFFRFCCLRCHSGIFRKASLSTPKTFSNSSSARHISRSFASTPFAFHTSGSFSSSRVKVGAEPESPVLGGEMTAGDAFAGAGSVAGSFAGAAAAGGAAAAVGAVVTSVAGSLLGGAAAAAGSFAAVAASASLASWASGFGVLSIPSRRSSAPGIFLMAAMIRLRCKPVEKPISSKSDTSNSNNSGPSTSCARNGASSNLFSTAHFATSSTVHSRATQPVGPTFMLEICAVITRSCCSNALIFSCAAAASLSALWMFSCRACCVALATFKSSAPLFSCTLL
mmetsp:Transcript_21078/g.58900  ORF Transcript_21078/g.58900 Transcript_21078/m.58900 type:complete len:326 (+) Transcript_21078:2-979(+)